MQLSNTFSRIISVNISFMILILLPSGSLSQVKFCEIKFDSNLLNKRKTIEKTQVNLDNNLIANCSKIGVEYDLNKKPMPNKPIFACCRDADGIDSATNLINQFE